MSGIPVRKAPALSQPEATTDATPLAHALAVTVALPTCTESPEPDAALKSCEYAMTLTEVGQELGISRERVRQIESAALAKAKKILRRRGYSLEDLLGEDPLGDSQGREGFDVGQFLQDLSGD